MTAEIVTKELVTQHIRQWETQLDEVLCKDRYRIGQQLRDIKSRVRSGKPFDKLFQRLQSSMERSLELVKARESRRPPTIVFPEQLPISERREEIAEAISKHQVVVLAGETGSGKTTQLPKICLELGRGVHGMIGHTQPRRIAASTVATRIAEELNVELGSSVGYQVRFTDHSDDHTHIKLMTDGILLAEIQNDRYLSRYDTLIIDEAHERSLNIDFILGYLKSILPKRPDLKVIITSATIDLERFSKHFNDAPIIEVSGRTYPVDVLYRPQQEDQDDQYQAIIDAIDEILIMERKGETQRGGDFLVFLSGEREIREAALAIRRADFPHLETLPLYARLSLAEQTKVFQNHKGRRVVLATNVAETSLTVPGIRYVVDPGFARVSRYSYRTKIQRLPVEPISQASANQRKGRCGRVSNGVCIRLYEESDFLSRPEFTDAEILRTNLASVILQMLQLRIGDIREFPFVDRPDHRLINDGFNLLQALQAVNTKAQLTTLGRQVSTLPVDPRLGSIVLSAAKLGCLREALIIISALSVQDPRERPADKQQASDEKHRRFWHEQSDFLAYVNLWEYWEQQRQDLSQNQLRKLGKKEFISYLRMREWRDVHHQLRLAMKTLNLKENSEPANYDQLHKALLVGLLDYIGNKGEDREYLGTRNRKFHVFPGSSQFKKSPKWMVAGELLETAKLYAHTVAKVEPEWILNASRHLVKRNHFEPHYDAKRGQVMAYEKVTLYGLTLVEKQRVNFSVIDEKVSREVFIRAALVEGRYGQAAKSGAKPAAKQDSHRGGRRRVSGQKKPGQFFIHNQQLLAELHDLEAKSRRRDIVADEEVLFAFYDERIPEHIVNLVSFETWREDAEQENPTLLHIDRDRLMQRDAGEITEAQFPDILEWGGMEFLLSYHFEPGSAEDGVSVHVPVSVLHLVPEARLEWLVPGLLREKCIAMVKSLPKQWRKNFVPVPDVVDKCLQSMGPDNTPLHEVLAHQLKRHTTIAVPESAWAQMTLDDYYRMNIQVVDDRGKLIEQDRDLAKLRERYRDRVQQSLEQAGEEVERTGITSWNFGDLEESCQLKRKGVKIRAYPALVDEGDSVALKMHDNPTEAHWHSVKAIVRLAMLEESQTVKYLRKQLLKGKDIGLSVTNLGSRDQVAEDIIAASIRQLLTVDDLPRDEETFRARIKAARSDLIERAQTLEALLITVLRSVVGIRKQLKSSKNALALAFAAGDVNKQLDGLIFPNFLFLTPLRWLEQYPRYLQAIETRLEKVVLNVQKDKLMTREVEPHWDRYYSLEEKKGAIWCAENQGLTDYRWMIEELRVSLFAQTLKTLMPVSSKRLDKKWTEIIADL
ncbi:ATP-dependent RNA helicase HrpA [Marinibactrum halimedae]|uniref:ATP-dependent helicase n=1 Tax=Marinibactrum halimedae TaxID=1444977 RepID=A0AA37T7D3_9GAMM|nr:ATP-dependent RNA helicase HrpA [Marinibactrum halimedae]MCD9459128.1 ATP-dependent RNA helicase HrpA [Marinibactrum halimedae]GLS24730.1 ATP-dependent helicase [Marinibactrum halimedae]